MPDLDFETFLSSYSQQVQDLAVEARRLILEVMPDALEMVDQPSKIVAYGFDRTYAGLICAIAPYKTYLNLMFARGANLPDPEGLLQGTGKRARHVKINQQADLMKPGLRNLLLAAADLTRGIV